MRILRPRPSTLVCLSLDVVRLGGGFLEVSDDIGQIWRVESAAVVVVVTVLVGSEEDEQGC